MQLRDPSVRLGSFLETKTGARLPVTRDAHDLPTVRILFECEFPDSWDTALPVLPRSKHSDDWRMAAVRSMTSFKGGLTETGDWDEDYDEADPDADREDSDVDSDDDAFTARMNSVCAGLDRQI